MWMHVRSVHTSPRVHTHTPLHYTVNSVLQLEHKFTYEHGYEAVLDLLVIPMHNLLVSCSLDSTIYVWNTLGNHSHPLHAVSERSVTSHRGLPAGCTSRLNLAGVCHLAYSEQYSYLFSAGFDRDAYVWNPFIATCPVGTLRGHKTSLVGVNVVFGTPQVVTADKGGIIKVWDIRSFRCMQTLTMERHLATSDGYLCTSIAAVPPHCSIVVGASRLFVYDYDHYTHPDCADNLPILSAMYNDVLNTFITVAGTTVKVRLADCVCMWLSVLCVVP